LRFLIVVIVVIYIPGLLWNKHVLIFCSVLVQKYHPSRVLTLVYQPFAVGTLAILAYKEDRINTRIRNLFGYTLFFISTLALLIVSLIHLFVIFDSSTKVLTFAFVFPINLP